MKKQLQELTKEELISTVQDYQEMVSEIETYLNFNLDNSKHQQRIRELLYERDFLFSTHEITMEEFLKDYNWETIFDPGYNGNHCDPCPPASSIDTSFPKREDVEKILAIKNGINDEDSWMGVFLLKDGRYLFSTGWCDYTGWDCQGGTNHEVSETLEDLLKFGMSKEERTILKM